MSPSVAVLLVRPSPALVAKFRDADAEGRVERVTQDVTTIDRPFNSAMFLRTTRPTP